MKPLSAALALALCAGCLGLPEGAPSFGDTVEIRYDIVDPATGETLVADLSATFVLGAGEAPFAPAVERTLRHHAPNETFDAVGSPVTEVTRDRHFTTLPAENEIDRQVFADNFGEPSVGQPFPLNEFYRAQVTEVTEALVRYRILVEGEQRNDVPIVGAVLVTAREGDELVLTLEPQAGAVFTINPPSPFNPSTPLGLEPGHYQVVGLRGDAIVYRHSQYLEALQAGSDDLVLRITLVSVTRAAVDLAEDPDVTVRGGAQLRNPAALASSPTPEPAAA